MTEHGPWKVLATREVYRDPWLTLTSDDVIRPDGRAGTFAVVRTKAGVSVLAVDEGGTAHLTEEFRYAIGRPSLEVVSGAVEAGEEPLAAARRELKEELGIEASDWTDFGTVDPTTSMVFAPVRLFLARGLRVGEPAREGTEQIRRVRLPLDEAVRAVLEGRITHAPSCLLLLRAVGAG